MLNVLSGQYLSHARPMTVSVGIGPNERESLDSSRWSPSTNSWFGGTTQCACGVSGSVTFPGATYGSVSSWSLMNTCPSRMSMTSPGSPMTRLMYGMVPPALGGGANTTMSPRLYESQCGESLSMSTYCPGRSVFSMLTCSTLYGCATK